MANAHVHSKSSARRYGGQPEDYLNIHIKMDCSKAYVADNRHRALTHTNFWIHEVMIPIFGYNILEDFGMRFIPTAQDYLENMEFKDWMQNGIKGHPASFEKISQKVTLK